MTLRPPLPPLLLPPPLLLRPVTLRPLLQMLAPLPPLLLLMMMMLLLVMMQEELMQLVAVVHLVHATIGWQIRIRSPHGVRSQALPRQA